MAGKTPRQNTALRRLVRVALVGAIAALAVVVCIGVRQPASQKTPVAKVTVPPPAPRVSPPSPRPEPADDTGPTKMGLGTTYVSPADQLERERWDDWRGIVCPLPTGDFKGALYIPSDGPGDLPVRLDRQWTTSKVDILFDMANAAEMRIQDATTGQIYTPMFVEGADGKTRCVGIKPVTEELRSVTVEVVNREGQAVRGVRVAGCGSYNEDLGDGVVSISLPPRDCVVRAWCVNREAYGGPPVLIPADAEFATVLAPEFEVQVWKERMAKDVTDFANSAPLPTLPGMSAADQLWLNDLLEEGKTEPLLTAEDYGGACSVVKRPPPGAFDTDVIDQ